MIGEPPPPPPRPLPPRMPQFIEAWAVDTIQDCDLTICRSDCLHFPALTWIQQFSTQLNAPSCSPKTEPYSPTTLSDSFSVLPPPPLHLRKLQPYVRGDPRFKHTPWETTLLSTIDFKFWSVWWEGARERGGGKWQKVDGEIKKRETDEVKRGDLSMCVFYMCAHGCVCMCARALAPLQSSKSQRRLIAFQG